MTTPTPTNPDRISPAELRASFQALTERLDQIEAEITALRDGLTAAATAPAAAAAPAGQTVQFDANVIVVGVDEKGEFTYKAKGGQYAKFGVRIWPEVLPALGMDPDKLRAGPNAVNLRLVALMGDNGPRKVIGIIK